MSAAPQPLAARPGTLSEAEKLIEQLRQKLHIAELRVLVLEERLRLRRIEKYGAGSEKLSNYQLEMLEQEPGVSQQEVQAESERPIINGEVIEVAGYARKARRSHPGRQSLPADLPRVEKILACPADQCVCGQCGQPTTVIGYEESEQLEVEPAKYFVLVTKREKRMCTGCEGAKIVAAPLPARIIEKGLVSDGLVIDTVIRKYCDHLPLYRQSVILDRESGVDISRATLDGWVMQVGELLRPLVGVMGGGWCRAATCRLTRLPSRCRCTIVEGRITRPICGSTDNRGERRCSIFVWAEIVPDRNTFCKTFMGCCRPTAMPPMTKSGPRVWCMQPAGRIVDEALPMWSS